MKIRRFVTAMAATVGLLTAGIALPISAASSGAATGPIKIGYLNTLSGPLADAAALNGIQGVVNMVNKSGGIGGRKLQLITANDGGSPNGNLLGAQSLVSKGVFAVIETGLFTSASAAYLAKQGVPVVGTPFDGPEWSNPAYSNMFTWAASDGRYPAVTTWGKFLKAAGVTNLAVLGYGAYPTSYGSAENAARSAKAAGIKVGYTNTSLQITQVDFTTQVLAMKAAGVNGLFLPLTPTADLQVVDSAGNNGIKIKVGLSSGGGYEYQTIDQPTTLADSQGVYFSQLTQPFVDNTPATKAFEKDLKQYAGVTNATFPPDLSLVWNWVTTQLLVAGLKSTGPNVTQKSYIKAMHKLSNFTAGGIIPPVNEAKDWGRGGEGFDDGNCLYFVQLKGTKFIAQNGGKPICGTEIPNSDVLPNNPAP